MTVVGGVPRRLPSWSELAPLVRLQPFERDAVERRLRRAQDVAELRLFARRRTPRAVFDDVDGAAEDEVSLRRAKEAFARVQSPSILRDVSAVDTSTTVLGQPARLPLVARADRVHADDAAIRRDVRNGLTIPPALTARTVADMARHPNWWMSVLTTAPLEFASLRSWQGTVADLVNHLFEPSADVSDLEWLRSQWAGGSW